MPDRPPVADYKFVVNMTAECAEARAIGLALVAISKQLDRVIELLESATLAAEKGDES